MIQFYGWINSPVIASGFLIPVYTDGETFYFHELSKDNKTITGFSKFDTKQFKNDSISSADKPIPAEVGKESFMVIKFNNHIEAGSFSYILNLISDKITSGEIKSKALITNANRIFGKDFTTDVIID